MSAADGKIICIIGGHVHLNTLYSRSIGVILCFKGESAIEGIQRIHFSMKYGSRSGHIKSIGPHISTDGRIIVKYNQCLGSNGVTRLHSGFGINIEADVTLTMFQRVVDWQESHLRAHRFGTRSGVYTLEDPEHLIVHNINTCIHIHPHTQRVGHIQTLAIGRHIGRYGKDEIAKAEIRQAEGCQTLLVGHIVSDLHTRSRSHSKFGIILEIDGIIHFVTLIDKMAFFIIASRAFDFVGILSTFHLLCIPIQISPTMVPFGISNDTNHAKMAFARMESFGGHIGTYLVPARESVRRSSS